jgi:hypothetical protein
MGYHGEVAMESTNAASLQAGDIRDRAAQATTPVCPHCAQAVPSGRLSLASIASLVGKHLKLERGLLHTLVDLTLRPGAVLGGYFSGARRRDYLNPVTYLLLSAATSLLVFELYEDRYRTWMAQQIAAETRRQMPDGTTALGPASEFTRAYIESMFEVMQRTTFTSLALVIPFALLVWLLFRGPRLNLAEALAFAFYAMGTGLFLHSLVITPLLMAGQWDLAQHGGIVLYLAMPVWMGLAYFGFSAGRALRMLLAVLAGFAIGVVAIYVTVGVMVALRMLGH